MIPFLPDVFYMYIFSVQTNSFFFHFFQTFLTTAMVCIPCIVIPVLLWVYKRFLEPIIYPFIAPFINTFWNKKPVTEASDTSDQKLGENGICKVRVLSHSW